MTTVELIRALRAWADQMALPGRRNLVNEAADRLEDLDERVAIMEEGCGGTVTPGAYVDLWQVISGMNGEG